MAGCVYHCITAVPHDVSNSYKSTLSLLDSKCFVALLYFFPLYFKLLSCVTIIYWHPNSSTVRRSTVPGKGDQTAPHLGRTGPEGSGGLDAALGSSGSPSWFHILRQNSIWTPCGKEGFRIRWNIVARFKHCKFSGGQNWMDCPLPQNVISLLQKSSICKEV